MNTENLLIVVLGLVAVVGLMVIGLVVALRGRRDEFVAYAEQVLGVMVKAADARLAPLGPQLAPLHEGLGIVGGLADDPSDWLVKTLAAAFGTKPEVVIEVLKPLFEQGLALTDGEPLGGPMIPAPEVAADGPQEAVK